MSEKQLTVFPEGITNQEDFFKVQRLNGRTYIPPRGPLDAKLMIITAQPTWEDIEDSRLMSGEYEDEITNACNTAGLKFDDIYKTSVVKYGPIRGTKLTSELIAQFRPVLEHEISVVKPDLIMVLGAEAFKFLMKSNSKASDFMGEIIPSDFGNILVNFSPGVIILQDPKKRLLFQDNFRYAGKYLSGKINYTPYTWEVVDSVDRNIELLLGYINAGLLTVGFDGEWSTEGKMQDDGEVLHTFQYSLEPNKAIILDISKDGISENRALLNTMQILFSQKECKCLGWNIRADLKRLKYRGINVPEETIAFDGMKAVALIESRYPKGLETGCRVFTNYERYYVDFYLALKKHKIAPKDLCKLKFLEPDLFWKYCAGDAVSHRTACLNMMKALPVQHRPYYYNTYLPLTSYIQEMEEAGLPFDQVLAQQMTDQYTNKYNELKVKLLELVNPLIEDFNPASAPAKKKLLYKILKLDPPYYTKSGKSPKSRNQYNSFKPGAKKAYSPSTNNKSLSTLCYELEALVKDGEEKEIEILKPKLEILHTLLSLNRVSVFANKFLSKKGVLEDPIEGEEVTEDEDEDEPLKQSYWAALSKKTGRIHADFFECLNNFRSSSKPNVQNMAGKALSAIPDIFCPGYASLSKEQKKVADETIIPANFRNIFNTGNSDYTFAEVDVAGADLAIAAFVSRDQDYIKDILNGGFHLTKAREYFNDPTISKDNYSKYVSAKAITFRVAYTCELSSAANPIQAEIFAESGILVPMEELLYALNTWNRYVKYMAYRKQCMIQAEAGYIKNERGIQYTFDVTENYGLLASHKNESLAFPIASELALFLWDVSVSMKRQMQKDKTWMKWVFPVNSVHDAGYWLVHKDLVKTNYFPEICKYYFTDACKIATGDNLGMEMVVSDCWKGKEKIFSKETKWNFQTKCWDWKS